SASTPALGAVLRPVEFGAPRPARGRLPRAPGPAKYRHIKVHRIALDGHAKQLTADSKLNTDFDFFAMLHQHGRRAARRFLDAHFDDIGTRSTVDLRAEVTAERA